MLCLSFSLITSMAFLQQEVNGFKSFLETSNNDTVSFPFSRSWLCYSRERMLVDGWCYCWQILYWVPTILSLGVVAVRLVVWSACALKKHWNLIFWIFQVKPLIWCKRNWFLALTIAPKEIETCRNARSEIYYLSELQNPIWLVKRFDYAWARNFEGVGPLVSTAFSSRSHLVKLAGQGLCV